MRLCALAGDSLVFLPHDARMQVLAGDSLVFLPHDVRMCPDSNENDVAPFHWCSVNENDGVNEKERANHIHNEDNLI